MAAPRLPLKFSNVRLLVDDFPTVWAFYAKTLGLKHRSFYGEPPYGELYLGRSERLGIFDRRLMSEAIGIPVRTPARGSTGSVAVILEAPNVDRLAARLRRRNVKLTAPPTDRPAWGIRTLHFQDPEGNLIEAFSRTKRRIGGA